MVFGFFFPESALGDGPKKTRIRVKSLDCHPARINFKTPLVSGGNSRENIFQNKIWKKKFSAREQKVTSLTWTTYFDIFVFAK